MERFVLDTIGVDCEALDAGLDWCAEKSSQLGCEAAILVPSVNDIRNLGDAIGREQAEDAKNTRVIQHAGVEITILLARRLPHEFNGPLLVPWADTRMVQEAEGLRPEAICAIGWVRDGLEDWKRATAPIDLRADGEEVQRNPAPAEVRGAISHLSEFNGGGDVLHPNDKGRAITAFRALQRCDVEIDPVLVRGEALERSWSPAAADRLAQIAKKIAEGSTVQGGERLTKTEARKRVERFVGQIEA